MTNLFRRTLLQCGGLFFLGLTAVSCSRGERFIPPGSLMRDEILCEFAFYYPAAPRSEPLRTLDSLLKEKEFSAFHRAEKPLPPAKGTALVSVVPRLVRDARKSYGLPDRQALRYFARGFSAEELDGLSGTDLALVLDFRYRRENVWEAQKAILRLSSRLAHETGGAIWDDETREIFSPAAWDSKRLQTWTGEIPDLSRQFTIHMYKDGEYARAISLGLAKFGLPDILVQQTSMRSVSQVSALINLLSQALAEGATVGRGGQVDVDIRAIRNPKVREGHLRGLLKGSTGIAKLVLRPGHQQEGDPDNRVVEIDFSRYPGPDVHARQEALFQSFLGGEDATTIVKHDEELLAVSRRQREKLPSLREAFRRGLAPGESIEVKAPFAAPNGGREWMWVEVTSWQGDEIRGLLRNDPEFVPGLHTGQVVQVSGKDVFDYIRIFPNGTREGNETGALMERLSRGVAK